MSEYVVEILEKLLETKSIAGHSEEAIQLIESEAQRWNITTRKTVRGSLLLTIPGRDSQISRTLSGHVDTLGAMVKEIKSGGRLKFSNVGGFTMNSVEGEYCTLESLSGKKFRGTILYEEASVHVYDKPGEVKRELKNMEIRLDEEVNSDEDVRKLGISVGDYVFFDPRVEITPGGFIKSRHLDDKAGVACILAAIKEIKEREIQLPLTAHFFISTNEEVGHGASHGIPSTTAEFVAVDMGAVGQGQASDEFSVSICAKDSTGPFDYSLRRRLIDLCEKEEIPYKVDIYPHYGSDAAVALRAGMDALTGLIGPGVDASHSHERTHIKALNATIRLIVAYLNSNR